MLNAPLVFSFVPTCVLNVLNMQAFKGVQLFTPQKVVLTAPPLFPSCRATTPR